MPSDGPVVEGKDGHVVTAAQMGTEALSRHESVGFGRKDNG